MESLPTLPPGRDATVPEGLSRALRVMRAYVRFVHDWRYMFLFIWLCITVGLAFPASKFSGQVTSDLPAPEGSNAAIANAVADQRFGNQSTSTGFVLFFKASNPRNAIDLKTHFNYSLYDLAIQWYYHTGTTAGITYESMNATYYNGSLLPPPRSMAMYYSSYRAVVAARLPLPVANQYVTPDNRSAYVTLTFDHRFDDPATTQFSRGLRTEVDALRSLFSVENDVEGYVLGMPTFLDDISSSAARDIIVMFGVVGPIALIVFAYSLRSLRIAIVPFSSLVVTLLASFGIMNYLTATTVINALSPGVCAAIGLSLVLDYSYRICVRYVVEMRMEVDIRRVLYENLGDGDEAQFVMESVLAFTGRSIFISGICIAAATTGLTLFPNNLLLSIGLSCLVSSLVAMIVAWTFVPALLMSFNNFFARAAVPFRWPCLQDLAPRAAADGEEDANAPLQQSPVTQFREAAADATVAATGAANAAAATTSAFLQTASRALLMAPAEAMRSGGSRVSQMRHDRGFADAVVRSHSRTRLDEADGSPRRGGDSDDASSRMMRPSLNPGGGGAAGGYGGVASESTPLAAAANAVMAPVSALAAIALNNPQSSSSAPHTMAYVPEHKQTMSQTWANVLRRSKTVCAVVLLVAIGLAAYPIYVAGAESQHSNSIDLFVPRNSRLFEGWNLMRAAFRAGEVFPYNIIIVFNGVTQRGFQDVWFYKPAFPTIQSIVASMLSRLPETVPNMIDNIAYDGVEGGVNVSASESFFYSISTKYVSPKQLYYQVLFAMSMSVYPDTKPYLPLATFLLVRPNFDPTSEFGKQWYHAARALFDELEPQYNVSIYIKGSAADTFDTIEFADKVLPVVVVIVGAAMFLVSSLLFLSIGIPFRGLIILLLSGFVTFGVTNLICVKSILSFLPIDSLQGSEKAVAWLIPFAAILIVVAISLNSELCLSLRVMQIYAAGNHDPNHAMTTEEAVSLGFADTNDDLSISAAMTAILFCGLIVSETPAMNQLGIYLVVASLVHNFFSRVFISVPLMMLMGNLNWFPFSMLAAKTDIRPPVLAAPIEEAAILATQRRFSSIFPQQGRLGTTDSRYSERNLVGTSSVSAANGGDSPAGGKEAAPAPPPDNITRASNARLTAASASAAPRVATSERQDE